MRRRRRERDPSLYLRRRGRRAWSGALIFICLAGGLRAANGQDGGPAAATGGVYGLTADVEGQANPAGLDFSGGAWYRNVYRRDASPLWDGLYVEGGGQLALNPAYGQLSAYLEWLPVAVLQLHAQLDRYAYFGRDGSLLIFPDRNARFGPQQIRAMRGREQSGGAERLMLQPTLQGEIGRYAVLDRIGYAVYRFDRDGPYFWDQEYDTLLQRRDRLYANDLLLLYDFAPGRPREKLLVGPSFQIVHARGADLTRRRLGVSVDYEPAAGKSVFGYVRHPRYYLQTGVNVEDRNRQGQFYLSGGIGADLDLN